MAGTRSRARSECGGRRCAGLTAASNPLLVPLPLQAAQLESSRPGPPGPPRSQNARAWRRRPPASPRSSWPRYTSAPSATSARAGSVCPANAAACKAVPPSGRAALTPAPRETQLAHRRRVPAHSCQYEGRDSVDACISEPGRQNNVEICINKKC